MDVGGYVLDLYCDASQHNSLPWDLLTERWQFGGPNSRAAWWDARAAGWRRIKGKDICPHCMKVRKGKRGKD